MAKATKKTKTKVNLPIVEKELVDVVSLPVDIHNGKYFFFYKSKLSNWHMCDFNWLSQNFKNSEQAMMWFKAKLFQDVEVADAILATSDPKTIQDLGRTVKNFVPAIWNMKKENMMYKILLARFQQNAYLKNILLDTGDAILVEASPVDLVWGIGLDIDAARKTPDDLWLGQNLLGKALTRVRDELKIEQIA